MFQAANHTKASRPNAKKHGGNSLFFQPRLTVNQPGDIYEKEADAVADKVVRMPPGKTFFTAPPVQRKCDECEADEKKIRMKPAPSMIQRQGDGDKKADEKKPAETKPDEKKPEEAETGFIDKDSLWNAIKDIFGKLPERYQKAYNTYKDKHETFVFDLSESRKLASNEIMALWNLANALVYPAYSNYKDVGFGDRIKIMESLSGATDTYINLASLVLHKDMNKYISDEVPALVKKNLGFIILAGLLAQGGFTAVKYATSGEVDITTVINPFLGSFTAPPEGITNPLQLGNIADPRWKSPFSNPAGGPDFTYTEHTKDPKVAAETNFNLGFNIASTLSLYPKNEEDKKKYKGPEAYPFFNFTRSYPREGEKGDTKDRYYAGIFIGDKGVYTLLEGGVIKGPLGVMETYGKAGIVLKNLGNLRLLSVDAEADNRQPSEKLRTRVNAATQIDIVDNEKWQLTLGGTIGALTPGDNKPGSLDYGGSLALYGKEYSADKKDTYKTGFEIAASTRSQDPFDASSQKLLTYKAGLVFGGIVKLGLQYDQISGTGPVNTFSNLPPGLAPLPQNNLTVSAGVDIAPLLFRDEKKK